MSSPAAMPLPHSAFLSRWMPSRLRSGVILQSPGPDECFSGDFIPLCESRSSSCDSVDSVVGTALTGPDPVSHKLQQLQQWQKDLQAQLKCQQVNKLQCELEEQQRLLALIQSHTEAPQQEEESERMRLPVQQVHSVSGGDEGQPEETVSSNREDTQDRPIRPGKQTFEELLEEQLLLEEQRRQTASQNSSSVEKSNPKRTFLKRGEGLSRFTKGKATSHSRVVNCCKQRPPVQRKTTVLTKAGHTHRQNVPDVPQDGSEKRTQGGTRPSPAPSPNQSEFSFDSSFQEKLQRWDLERHRERVELGEFELLEQAAEEFSFSSNSSFIMKVLQLDRQPGRLSSTPIKRRSQDTEQQDQNTSVECVELQDTLVSDVAYDKTSYQDENVYSSQADVADWKDGHGNKEQNRKKQFVFDDDDTWNELEEKEGEVTPPSREIRRKVAAIKGVGSQSETPPTSQLMTRLFPSLRAKMKPAVASPGETSRVPAEEETDTNTQSRLLRERLGELEVEIQRFRSENSALAQLNQERKTELETLRKDRTEFEKQKQVEIAQLEELKREETRKLQRDRKLFEQHASAARALPSKRERDEIQALKQQLESLQEEFRRREARWSSTQNRLRQQLDVLGEENVSLREEVRALERLRLADWKKAEFERDSSVHNTEQNTIQKSTSPAGASQGTHLLNTSTTRSTQKLSCPLLGNSDSQCPAPVSPDSDTCVSTVSVRSDQVEEVMVSSPEGKIETLLPCGGRLVVFPNGNRKEVSVDGQTVKVTFFNGDVKQVTADQRVIYYYAETQTSHTTFPDGMEVLQFPNGQMEKHFPDGLKEITFPDQTVKHIYPDGKEESVFPDGTVIEVHVDGSKVIRFNNGQREVHTREYKRREYPDGTVKTVYHDGRQETRYNSGRVRVKDKDGRVVMDNRT